MDKQIVVFIKYFFGQDAKIERGRRCLLITTSCGDQVEFVNPEKGFRNYAGGPEIYRSSLRMMHHITKGPVAVRGTSDDIIACMAHGRELEIKVIPHDQNHSGAEMACGTAGMFLCWFILITMFFMNIIEAVCLSMFLAMIIALLSYPHFKRVSQQEALRMGQQYRDIFPEIHGSDRKASRDAARERGLL